MRDLLGHIILLGLFCYIVFTHNERGLFLAMDGSYRQEIIRYTYEWSNPTLNTFINPLQGLGSLAFPLNTWLSPACLINYLIYKNEVCPVLIYSIISIELFGAIYWLGTCMAFTKTVKFLACWLAIIFIMPVILTKHSNGLLSLYPITGIIPDVAETMAVVSVILGLITKIDLAQFQTGLKYALAVSVLVTYVIIAGPAQYILIGPLVALFILYWLGIQVSSMKTFYLALAAVLVIYLPSIPPSLFAAGYIIDSPAAFFPQDFAPDRPTWIYVSLLFHGPCRAGWMGTILFLSGMIGAVVSLFARGEAASKKIALIYATYSILLVLTGLFFTFIFSKFRVPSSLYLEWFIWPFMFLYGAFLWNKGCGITKAKLFGSAETGSSQFMERLQRPGYNSALVGGSLILAILAISLTYAQRGTVKQPELLYPPVLSSLNAQLAQKLSLSPGSNWKGCVATITECQDPAKKRDGSVWPDQLTWDYKIWKQEGTDYRSVGLWWLNIPTLFIYSPVTSPDYYFVITRFLADPRDVQNRSAPVLTQPNLKILGLLGVKILITDTPVTPDVQSQVTSLSNLPQNIFAYELTNTNLSGISAQKTIQAASAQDTVKIMSAADFDPSNEAVVYEPLPSNLTSADHQAIVWDKGGVRITANAPGPCLLVLPLQYTHCIRLNPTEAGSEVKLIRVDMTLTGILFSHSLDVHISPNYGPFTNVFGKFEDYFALKHLL